MTRIIRVVTADESVEFDVETVNLRHKPEGVSISPRTFAENTLGFRNLFFPWGEIRQIKEYDKDA